jgi:glycosyltransferase involved in cell wall biosynthesis
LIAVGRHVAIKSFNVAIEAIALANKRAGKTQCELVLVGDGPERLPLERLAKTLRADRAVRFTGWLDNVNAREELDRSDALIVPSTFEGYSVVVLEALAQGRPVLASQNVTAAIDRNNGSGALVFHDSGDANALANQIEQLANNRDELERRAAAARAIAEEWPAERAVQIMQRVLGQAGYGRRIIAENPPDIPSLNKHRIRPASRS